MSLNQLKDLLVGTYFKAREEDGCIVISLRARTCVDNTLPYRCVEKEERRDKRNEFGEKNILKHFLWRMGRAGILYAMFGQENFLKPDGYEVHHILPICFGGTNDIKNLCLIPEEAHKKLHEKVWNPLLEILKKYPMTHEIYIETPPVPQILTNVEKFVREDKAQKAIDTEKTYQSLFNRFLKNRAKIRIAKREARLKRHQKDIAFFKKAHGPALCLINLNEKPKEETATEAVLVAKNRTPMLDLINPKKRSGKDKA